KSTPNDVIPPVDGIDAVEHGNLQAGFLRFFLDGTDNLVPLLCGQGFVIHVKNGAHTVFATAFCNFSELIRMDWPCPSLIMPISSCVIWPIFSFSVIWARSFSTAAAEALAGGPAGVKFCRKNASLSTIREAASSAPDGTATTVQTASTITICQSLLCGVDTGISFPSILPPGGRRCPNFGFPKIPIADLLKADTLQPAEKTTELNTRES